MANVGADCRETLSRHGLAFEMSSDHKPCCHDERIRVESLGGFIRDGYLNGELGVTRVIGNWHIEGLKETGDQICPSSAEPELKMVKKTSF